MRFGSPSLKSTLLAWYYAHLSLPFDKVGCGSVVPSLKSTLLAWYYAHLSLPFDKVGCGSVVPSLKSTLLAWYYAHLSLPFDKVGCGSVVLRSKASFWLGTTLTFHYLCIRISSTALFAILPRTNQNKIQRF